jgi:hypothetical protein
MSKATLQRSDADQWLDIRDAYQLKHPGPFRPEDVVAWAVENGLCDLPRINPATMLVNRLRRALRSARMRDSSGRLVREMVPARFERVDENGNYVFDVVWDYLHSMSLEHALRSFDQRDRNILKQRHSASRDVQSCLENNPNVKGHDQLFLFDFFVDEAETQAAEEMAESPLPRKPK